MDPQYLDLLERAWLDKKDDSIFALTRISNEHFKKYNAIVRKEDEEVKAILKNYLTLEM